MLELTESLPPSCNLSPCYPVVIIMKPGDRVVYIGKNYKHGTVFVLKREIDHGWWTNDASFVYKSNIVPEREYMFNKLVDEYYGL